MPTSLRVVKFPGPDIFDADMFPVPRPQEWLEAHAPALAAWPMSPSIPMRRWMGDREVPGKGWITFKPGTWYFRCADNTGQSAAPGMLRAQFEQDALHPDEPFKPFKVTRLPAGITEPPADHEWPKGPIGLRFYRDTHAGAKSLVAMNGDRRMALMLGFGAPDSGKRAPWSMTEYQSGAMEGEPGESLFGPENQIALYFAFARYQGDRWISGKKRTVLLYTGEVVECGDPVAFRILQYTPTEHGLVVHAEAMRKMFPAEWKAAPVLN